MYPVVGRWSLVGNLVSASAYYSVFSIPPLLVVAIGIISFFIDRASAAHAARRGLAHQRS